MNFLFDSDIPISNKCCNIMKKNPMKKYEKQTGRVPILGTTADESKLRLHNWIMYGCNAFDAPRPRSTPMAFWTKQDVLQYIVEYNVPYASVYGEIKQDNNGRFYTTKVDRTGCMFCMYGCHLEKEPNRFQKMKETHPNQYNYCMRSVEEGGLGLARVLDYINVPYE